MDVLPPPLRLRHLLLSLTLSHPPLPPNAAWRFEFSNNMSPKKAAAASCQSKNKKQKPDIPTLTDEERRVVLIQYEKENEPDDAESLIVEYLRFMAIKIWEKDAEDKRAAPSKMIDEMWHAHILSTKEYFAFCERHNDGEYIHHDPSMVDVLSRYRLTHIRYIELFDEVPKDATIWPHPPVWSPPPVGESDSEGYPSDGDPGCG